MIPLGLRQIPISRIYTHAPAVKEAKQLEESLSKKLEKQDLEELKKFCKENGKNLNCLQFRCQTKVQEEYFKHNPTLIQFALSPFREGPSLTLEQRLTLLDTFEKDHNRLHVAIRFDHQTRVGDTSLLNKILSENPKLTKEPEFLPQSRPLLAADLAVKEGLPDDVVDCIVEAEDEVSA